MSYEAIVLVATGLAALLGLVAGGITWRHGKRAHVHRKLAFNRAGMVGIAAAIVTFLVTLYLLMRFGA